MAHYHSVYLNTSVSIFFFQLNCRAREKLSRILFRTFPMMTMICTGDLPTINHPCLTPEPPSSHHPRLLAVTSPSQRPAPGSRVGRRRSRLQVLTSPGPRTIRKQQEETTMERREPNRNQSQKFGPFHTYWTRSIYSVQLVHIL